MIFVSEMLERARKLDEQRLEHDRASKELTKEVDKLKNEIISFMKANNVTEVDGSRIIVKQKPFISDWSALDGYIREHDATDLLQKRLTESAVKLRWEDGIQIPGVGLIVEEKLQL